MNDKLGIEYRLGNEDSMKFLRSITEVGVSKIREVCTGREGKCCDKLKKG